MVLRRGRCRLSELLGTISQVDFARKMYVSEATVSNWIQNKRGMSYENAINAAQILNCCAEDLYEWIDK